MSDTGSGPKGSAGLDSTQGALFIGTSVAGILFGVSCLQAFFYANHYLSDPWRLKALVAATFICDMLHQLMCSHSVYEYLITNYGNPQALASIPWSLVAEVQATAFIGLFVQSFYATRVYRLSEKNWWLTAIVSSPILPSFAMQTVYTIKMSSYTNLGDLGKIAVLAQTINVLNAVCDIMISIAMVYLLHKSRTGLKQSNTMINRLVIFVVNTGLLTSACATLALILLLASPNTLIYAVFFFTTPRLYANSLFATLNARTAIRTQAIGPHPSEGFSLSFARPGVLSTQRDVTGGLGQASQVYGSTTRASSGFPLDIENRSDSAEGDIKIKRLSSHQTSTTKSTP